jgi:hypothetical protein
MKLTVEEYAKKSKVSPVVIRRRINRGVITPEVGRNKRGNPCMYIDTDDFPPTGPGKPGAPRKRDN